MKSTLRVFDANIHGDLNQGWSQEYFQSMALGASEMGISAGNITFLPGKNSISLDKLVNLAKNSGKFEVIRGVDIINEDLDMVLNESIKLGCIGFKIHPRIYKHSLDDLKISELCVAAQEIGVPIQICSFDDGTWNRLAITKDQFSNLADKFPKTNFIFMHAGGHRVIDFMLLARRRPNVHLDLSFSLNYFNVQAIHELYSFCIGSMNGRQWIFGSDFPSVNFDLAIDLIKNNLYTISNSEKVKILNDIFLENARKLFPKHVWLLEND